MCFRFLLRHYFVDRPSQALDLFLDLNSKQNTKQKDNCINLDGSNLCRTFFNTLIKRIERKVFESSNFIFYLPKFYELWKVLAFDVCDGICFRCHCLLDKFF